MYPESVVLLTNQALAAELAATAWFNLTVESRTTYFQLWLFVLLLIRMKSLGQLLTYLIDWLTWQEILPLVCRGLTLAIIITISGSSGLNSYNKTSFGCQDILEVSCSWILYQIKFGCQSFTPGWFGRRVKNHWIWISAQEVLKLSTALYCLSSKLFYHSATRSRFMAKQDSATADWWIAIAPASLYSDHYTKSTIPIPECIAIEVVPVKPISLM